VTDAFIKLEDAGASVDEERNLLCMKFKDKIPYHDVTIVPAVGNAANAAVSAARLGLKTAFISDVGADDWGRECLDTLKKNKVDTQFVASHEGEKTNYHYVLWYGDERTILVKHEKYDYVLPGFGEPKWVYFSSMSENALPFHDALVEYLNIHPNVKLAFQPGTYQMKFGKDRLSEIYKRSDFFVCNKEEAERILETEERDIKKLLEMMHKVGPRLVVITDGKNGAYTYDGAEMWSMPLYPDPKPPVDRTGAGDAFSSTLAAFLATGMSTDEALRRAPINSMSVVQYVGAQEGLLSKERLEEFLANAPRDYVPKQL